jgi:MFS family permease
MITMRRTVPAAEPAGPGPRAADRARWYVMAPLLLGTFLGTVNNNIVSVPLNAIVHDFGVAVGQGALIVIAFSITVAALMPIAGWTSDRIGRRRVFCWSVAGVGAGALGAAFAPNLATLVIFRILQGAASASVVPAVLGIITEVVGVQRRGRAVGLWAGANGLGQAVGPPLGGLIAGAAGWRWIFAPTVLLAIIAVPATLRLVPRDAGRLIHLEWRGALSLTAGAALLLTGAAALPIAGVASPAVVVPMLLGLGSLWLFWRAIHRLPTPFIAPALLSELSFLRSSLAVAAQMFCLGSMLLGIPLYLTRVDGVSVGEAGLLVFTLPALMTLLAPVAGMATVRWGGRITLRCGLALLMVTQIGLALVLRSRTVVALDLALLLGAAGAGIAFVQTSAATGATRSPAGRLGAGLGLFNLLRFTGSGLGATWVAGVVSSGGSFAVIFAGTAVVGLLGLLGAFAGGRRELTGPATPEEVNVQPM